MFRSPGISCVSLTGLSGEWCACRFGAFKPILAAIDDTQAGSHAFIGPHSIWVNLDHTMYLSKSAELAPEGREAKLIKVNRDSQGAYHLDFQGQVFQREPRNISVFLELEKLVPVESFPK
jgi:hypothetical protein